MVRLPLASIQLPGQIHALQHLRRCTPAQAQPDTRQLSGVVAHNQQRVIDARPASPSPTGWSVWRNTVQHSRHRPRRSRTRLADRRARLAHRRARTSSTNPDSCSPAVRPKRHARPSDRTGSDAAGGQPPLADASWVRPAAWSSELAAGVSMSSSPLGLPAKIRGRSGPFQAPPASVRRSFGARSHDHSKVHHRCRAVDSRLIPHAKTIDPSWTFWGRVLPGRVGNQLNGSIGSGSEFHLYVPRHD